MKKKVQTIELTTKQYADLRGINVSHVQRYAGNGKDMDGVVLVKRFGKAFVLCVDSTYYKELSTQAGKCFEGSEPE